METLQIVLSIVLVDLVLGGDNAVVIAMASRALPPAERTRAIYWGTAGAVGLRFLFAGVATFLLAVPYVMIAGGLLLLWIAYKLVAEESGHQVAEATTLLGAIRTIIVADAVMSLDNALAIAGVAHGHIGWMAFGILLSVPVIVFGSQFIVAVMDRFPVIMYLGSCLLAWTAGHIIGSDPLLHREVGADGPNLLAALSIVLVFALAWTTKVRRAARAAPR